MPSSDATAGLMGEPAGAEGAPVHLRFGRFELRTDDRRLLADYDVAHHGWSVAGGSYTVAVGASSADLTLTGQAKVTAQRLKP